MPENTPSLKIHINYWSLIDEADYNTQAGIRTYMEISVRRDLTASAALPSFPGFKNS
jgi:hypothetical protein